MPASSDDCAEGNLQTPVTRRQGQQLIFDSDDSTASSAGDLHASQNINIGQNVSTLPIAAATENSSPMTDAATGTGLTNHPGSLAADSLGNQNISVDRTNSAVVGDRFYVATAERRKNGLRWEAECGASECGLYELRYYHGPGTQHLVAKSKTNSRFDNFVLSLLVAVVCIAKLKMGTIEFNWTQIRVCVSRLRLNSVTNLHG